MSNPSKQPERLRPFYESPEPCDEIRLVEGVDAKLTQEGIEVDGKLTIMQTLSPVGLFWDFTCGTPEKFKFGQAKIASKSFTALARVMRISARNVGGHIEGEVLAGTEHKLTRVTFHLPDYPDLTGETWIEDELMNGTQTTTTRWSEVRLEADGWTIRLQPYRDIFALRQRGRETQKVMLSGVGEIRRTDGTEFKRDEVQPLLEALRIYLSFAFAEWSPPLLAVGSNDVSEKSCQFWGNYDVVPKPFLKGWLDQQHGQHLAVAFPGFMALWSRKNWREPLVLAVTWLIEASRLAGGVEGGIAFGQIPLEMLAWLVFVDHGAILDGKDFEGLSAASTIQLLLSQCGIPLAVPPELKSLTAVVAGMQKAGQKLQTGPQITTKVRNTIIHPHEKNRKQLFDWEKGYGVAVNDVRWETHLLFRWYITLVLLRMIGYSGDYANRLSHRKIGQVEPVPWAVPQV